MSKKDFIPDEDFMRMAIAKAARGIAAGQYPYGAAIVRGDELIACFHNVVMKTTDPTAHAEVHAIRRACAKLATTDLAGCDIYCTCEPCAMCMGACYWANIRTIFFGASISDKDPYHLRDLGVGAWSLSKQCKTAPKVVRHVLRSECTELFAAYIKKGSTAAPRAGEPPEHKPVPRRRR